MQKSIGRSQNRRARRPRRTTATSTRLGVSALAILAVTLVPTLATGAVAPPASAAEGATFTDQFDDGLANWKAVGGGPVAVWQPASDTDNTWISIDNRTTASGSYITPVDDLNLPSDVEVSFQLRVDELGAGGNTSLVVGLPQNATKIQAGGTALQIYGEDTIRTQRPVTNALCTGQAPVELGSQVTITVQRYDDLVRFLVDGQQVAVHNADDVASAGETIAIGSYRSLTAVSSVSVRSLSSEPKNFPDSAVGCAWVPSELAQQVMVNQSGYDLGMPKRFSAPSAEDGAVFTVLDQDETAVAKGTVKGGVGDFSDFDPTSEGPYTVRVSGAEGVGDSYAFGIGPSWTTRIAYEKALRFMAGSLCWFGDFSRVGTDALVSEVNGPEACRKGVMWRDASQYGFEIDSIADLLSSNPEIILQIPGDADLFTNAPDELPAETPLVAQLLYWGAEVLVAEKVNDPQLKGQLAAFLEVYPLVSTWVPQSTYDKVRDYVFVHWDETAHDRFVWQAYTPDYDGNLLGVYSAVGTGKGELTPGFSIGANLALHEVALREGRDDAGAYLDAAVAQADWISENLDPADPAVSKGQRQSEWVLVTALVRLATEYPDVTPPSVEDFVSTWADVVIDRTDNLWDFRKFDDSGTATDRWTIPAFMGGGTGEDPNESGNVAGLAAPALAAAHLLGADDIRSKRLTAIGMAGIDNIFGRNPTGRAAQYRVNEPGVSYEGLDKGWFSEYQGGFGILQGLPGVLDGSPKNGHYPYTPGMGNIGHTEGWVNANTAFNASLAWIGFAERSMSLSAVSNATGSETNAMTVAPAPGDDVLLTVTGPFEIERRDDVVRTVEVTVGDDDAFTATLTRQGGAYTAVISSAGAEGGDVVTASVGSGVFRTVATLTLGANEAEEPGIGDPGTDDPGTTVPGGEGSGAPEADKSGGDTGVSSGDTGASADGDALPVTGVDITWSLLAVLVLLATGAVAAVVSRRRTVRPAGRHQH